MSTSRRRRVLVLAYYFPPIGGGGVQHSLKLTRYLPTTGYEPLVVTGGGKRRHRWTPLDGALEAEVPSGLQIERLSRPEPESAGHLRDRGERWLELPSRWARWWIEGAVDAARRLPAFDVIYASMSPYETAAAAARIALERDVPWVAGLRDPWALDEMIVYPSGIHRRLEQSRMHRAVASASAVVMNTPEAAVRLKGVFPDLDSSRVVAITNGFDPADFAGPVHRRAGDEFRIVHTGYLHTEAGRHHRRTASLHRVIGGAAPGVDILTRSHVYLLRAVDLVFERRPDLRTKLVVQLAGVVSSEDERVVRAHGEHVQVLGYLPHNQSVALVRDADLLFLPMQGLPAGQRATIVPAKTYEYLASGRPILGGVPEGDARDFLLASGRARVCSPHDVEAMASAIEAAIARRAVGPTQVDPEFLARFERPRLAAQLADVLDRVVEESA